MDSSDEWKESLDNIDDLISCMGSLETEDVIYLEEYLIGEGCFDPKSPSLWSSLKESSEEECSLSLTTAQEEAPTDCPHRWTENENFEDPDDPQPVTDTTSRAITTPSPGERPLRSTRGIARPKFVTYQSFPPTKEKPFLCELCGRRLATRESRRRHILAKHIKERNNFCNICGKSFVFKFALKAHKGVHSATPNFICVCGQTFGVRGSYMDHVRRVHRAASEVKYPCELCFKSFGDRHTLRLHLISVHKPKTIACLHSGCNKVFSTNALMKSHYWYHLKQRFTCNECGQSFSTESYMNKHRRTHAGIRPYVCIDCGKTYLSVSHLNKHRRAAHSSYRPFQCSFCGKCYKTKDQLTYHESSHRGEKPYQCDVCGYATAYRNTYYAHRKKHRSSSTTNNAQKKGQGGLSSTPGNMTRGHKNHNTTGMVKDKGKLIKRKLSLPDCKTGLEMTPSEVNPPPSAVSPQVLSLNATHGNVGAANAGRKGPVNVICVASSDPNSTADLHPGLAEVNTSITDCVKMQSESQCKETNSSTSYVSSASPALIHSQGTSTEIIFNDSIQNGKLESLELLANSGMPSETVGISSERQDPCILFSNAAKSTTPIYESNSESLLFFKLDDNSYVAFCTQPDAQKEGTSLKEVATLNLSAQVLESLSNQEVYESKNAGSSLQPVNSSSVTLREMVTGAHLSSDEQSGTHGKSDKPTQDSSSVVQQMPSSASTTTEVCVVSSTSAVQQTDSVKTSSEVCIGEHFQTMMELDSTSLSGHIVDESFSLAQLEVHCSLCEEQFLCMDDYVTHLECCHN